SDEIEADRLRRGRSELTLRLDRIRPRQDRTVGLVRAAANGIEQRHKLGAQAFERRGDGGARRAGLVVVEQRVVLFATRAENVGFFALESHDLFEPRSESRKVLLLAGFDPGMLRERRRPRKLFDQPLRQLRLAIEVATRFADESGLGAVLRKRSPRLEITQQFADRGIGRLLVCQPGEQGKLIRPVLRSARRQVRLLVPAQQGRARSKDGGLVETPNQVVEASIGHRVLFRSSSSPKKHGPPFCRGYAPTATGSGQKESRYGALGWRRDDPTALGS